ncbi:MAG: hypothetical protein QM753_05815 [Thermomicrobiales bacterium]
MNRALRQFSVVACLLQMVAVLMLVPGVQSVAASPTAQEAAEGGVWSLGITANTGPGAHFVVTNESGDYIGECTLPVYDPPVPWGNCRVDVPSDRVSLVWEDLDSIPGYAPKVNPIAFDPTTYETGPHNIGAGFENVPTEDLQSTDSSAAPIATMTPASSSSSNTSTARTSAMPLTIRATSCDNAQDGCWDEVGARFKVKTEDGAPVGECTLEAEPGKNAASCSVAVPADTIVIVTEDVTTITPGFAPRSNPIRFDTGVAPDAACVDCHWGPSFSHGPKPEDASGMTGTKEMMIWAGPNDAGVHFTVTTEDGEYVGECTLDGPVMERTYCSIPVPLGTVVIVTEDVGTLAPGLAPESNPIRFDTGVEPFDHCAPCHWGPEFRNGLKATGSATDATSTTTESARTWTASVQVRLCESGSNGLLKCHGEAGITASIYLASGELMGTCTTGAPVQFPGGDMISTCTVEGLPFNADFVANQDISTVPAGYEPDSSELTLHVDTLYPGGGDQATFTFTNVRSASGSSGASNTGGGNESATLLITFRACPEGFDPSTGDFYAECTIPLDAPDAAVISWGGDGQGGMNITGLDRQYDGAYIYAGGPMTMSVQLFGLEPVLRDAYQVFGADGGAGGGYRINLVNSETRQVFVFYYYQ